MAHLSEDASRQDPYRNFKFRVKWDGRTVAGFSQMSALKRSVEHHEAGGPSVPCNLPVPGKYEAITLERGVTHDSEFESWASTARKAVARVDSRDILVEIYDERGQVTSVYDLRRCFVSEYQAIPDLDANAGAIAIQHIKLRSERLA
jgi:phage tail-like protein